MDWALVKVKGDMTSSATGLAGESDACTMICPTDSIINPLKSQDHRQLLQSASIVKWAGTFDNSPT